MTLLILSLWASGVLLLIAVAVYRGKTSTAGHSYHVRDRELAEAEIAAISAKLRERYAAGEARKVSPETKPGRHKFHLKYPSIHSADGRLVASAGKPLKPGSKGAHVHFPKPGKPVGKI